MSLLYCVDGYGTFGMAAVTHLQENAAIHPTLGARTELQEAVLSSFWNLANVCPKPEDDF